MKLIEIPDAVLDQIKPGCKWVERPEGSEHGWAEIPADYDATQVCDEDLIFDGSCRALERDEADLASQIAAEYRKLPPSSRSR